MCIFYLSNNNTARRDVSHFNNDGGSDEGLTMRCTVAAVCGFGGEWSSHVQGRREWVAITDFVHKYGLSVCLVDTGKGDLCLHRDGRFIWKVESLKVDYIVSF